MAKVIYEFDPYEDRDELLMHQKAQDFYSALWDIHSKCREVWKREENPTDDRIKLAEDIADIISESGMHEIS